MQNFKLLILVVLYNKNIYNSDTLLSLANQYNKKFDLFIWDNSLVSDNINSKYCDIYLHTPDNQPLSKVYSYVIDYCTIHGYSHLLLLDHDSKLESFYTEKIIKLINSNDKSVLVPFVKVNDNIVSPASNFYYFGWYCNGKPKYKYFSAINSGVCFPLSLIEHDFKYPIGLKNYGTDVFLFDYFKKKKSNFTYINSIINHDLTFSKYNHDNESYLKSYLEHIRSMEILYSTNLCSKICFSFYKYTHSLMTSIKRKDLIFFKRVLNDK